MSVLISFVSGVLFSIGLSISGMVNPTKVIGFLDITGNWDPSLMFVMAGAVIVNFVAYHFILKRKSPLLEKSFFISLDSEIDKKLIIGSTLFGIGWGVAGICPGPAIANMFTFNIKILSLLLFMIIGMLIGKRLKPKL